MGWRAAFTYDRPADIYRGHARLSAYRNEGRRLFDIGHHAALTISSTTRSSRLRWGGAGVADGCFRPPRKARLSLSSSARSTARCPSGR